MKLLKLMLIPLLIFSFFCGKDDMNFIDKKAEDFKIVENPRRGILQKSLPENYNFAEYNKVVTEKGFAVEFSYRIGADRYSKNKVFKYPRNFNIDSKGNIYIVDTGNNRVQKFTRSGKYILTIGGEKGKGIYQFDDPSDIAFDSEDNLYVTDFNNKRVQVFTENGEYIKTLKFKNRSPAHIAIDSKDNIFLTDRENYDAIVDKYDNDGNLLLSFGKPLDSKKAIGVYVKTYSQAQIIIDDEDNVYVCYKTENIIDKYDNNGIHLMRITKEPRKWIQQRIEDIKNFNLDTKSKRYMPIANDISISPEGFIWIANIEGVDIYSPDGTYLYFIRTEAKGGTEFVPDALLVKNEKLVYFINQTSGTLTIFSIIKKNVDEFI